MKNKKITFLQISACLILIIVGIKLTLQLKDSYHIYKTEKELQTLKKEKTKKRIESLKKLNSDVIGWIIIDDTNINYPIVKQDNNTYYLNHDIKKQKNQAGWIFMDYRNNKSFNNKNTILYGHGRIDGTMFGTLKKLLKEDWWKNKNHQIITTINPEKKINWEIFSVYIIKAENYYLSTYFTSTNSYQQFLNTIKKRSIYSFPTAVSSKDQIITLSTCKNEYNERIVVHAKKKEEQLT